MAGALAKTLPSGPRTSSPEPDGGRFSFGSADLIISSGVVSLMGSDVSGVVVDVDIKVDVKPTGRDAGLGLLRRGANFSAADHSPDGFVDKATADDLEGSAGGLKSVSG